MRLYLALSENAIVTCVDEKSQVQALDRIAQGLQEQPGKPAWATHDYTRHKTSRLFGVPEIATGHDTAVCKQQHCR